MGTPVIDELRICYIADPSLLADLARIEIGKNWKLAPFTLFRQGSDAYDVLFAICIGGLGDYQQIGLLKFGRYGAKEAPYAYYKVSNEALYSPDILWARRCFRKAEEMVPTQIKRLRWRR